MDQKHIVIIGNCQAQAIEGILIVGKPDIKVTRLPPVFKLTESSRQEIISLYEQVDHIFLQRVDASYFLEWVRPNWVRDNFKTKVVVWPNIYFDGYFPDVQYIYTAPYGKLQGPLDDYHIKSVIDAYKEGKSVRTAHTMMTDRNLTKDSFAFQRSLDNLIEREKDVDIKISDFLAQEVGRRRAFYTPNHPYNFVLVEMALRLVRAIGLDDGLQTEWRYHLDKISIPTYASIRLAQSISFAENYIYKGVVVEEITDRSIALGGTKEYDAVDLIETYYEIYKIAFKNAGNS